jgi:hypothetical protein
MTLWSKRAYAYAVAFGAGFIAWYATQVLVSLVAVEVVRSVESPVLTTLYVMAALAAAAGAGWGTLRMLRRRRYYTPVTIPRVLAYALVGAYLLTWVFGVPAAQSDVTRFAIDEYKRMRTTYPDQVFASHPWIRFTAAVPIAPGVIVTYYEYQMAGLYGFGGWGLHVWYVRGTRQLASWPVWLS